MGIAPDGADIGAEMATRLWRATGSEAVGRDGRRRRPTCPAVLARARALRASEAAARAALAVQASATADIATRYETDLIRLVDLQRSVEHDAHPDIGAPPRDVRPPTEEDPSPLSISAADAGPLLELRRAWFDAVGVHSIRLRNEALAAHLQRLKNRRLGVVTAPSRAARARDIATAAAKLSSC
jgi:hypothetical protein